MVNWNVWNRTVFVIEPVLTITVFDIETLLTLNWIVWIITVCIFININIDHKTECPWYDTKLHLMLRLNLMELGVYYPLFHHYSPIYSSLQWLHQCQSPVWSVYHCDTMVGIRTVGVGKCQSEDFLSILAQNPHKELAREISHETRRGRGKEGPRAEQRRRLNREVKRTGQSAGESRGLLGPMD